MSWIEKTSTGMTITTGDGKAYTPNWMNASKAVEYNVAQFEFKETAGSYVKRGTPRGTKYAIDITFQGEDHLDVMTAFEVSAADPKPWKLSHPLYGSLLVQPVGLVFDNTTFNTTRITGGLIETISQTPDVPKLSPVDKIISDKVSNDGDFLRAYTDNIPQAKVADIQRMIRTANATYQSYVNKITNNADLEKLNNLYSTANAAFRTAVSSTTSAVESLQAMISLPVSMTGDALARLAMLQNLLVFTNASLAATTAATVTRSAKLMYEMTVGCIISSMLAVAVTPGGRPYRNRREVTTVIDQVLAAHDSYLLALDSIQTPTGATPDSYVPSRVPLTTLGTMVGYTLTSLITIANSSRQVLSFFLEEDSNAILLTHRLYGLNEDDSTLTEFLQSNEIGLNELLNIRKGRLITYYR